MTRESFKREPVGNPDWVLAIGPDVAASIATMDAACHRYREVTKNGYTYRHVVQKQITGVIDHMIAGGVIDPRTGAISGNAHVSRQFQVAMLYQNASGFRMLGMISVAKQMVLVHLLEAARSDLLAGNLIGAMTNYRSIIEHVAHFDAIVCEIQAHAIPTDVHVANQLNFSIIGMLVKTAYATRSDWDALVSEEFEDLLKKNKIKYKPEVGRQDRTAETILNAVDGISKRVKGVRGAYEVLCEFAHPNVGCVMALTKSAEPIADDQGILWIQKQLTLGCPTAAIVELGHVLNFLFKVTAQCVAHFDGLLADAEKQRLKVQQISQVVLRHALANNRDLLSPYAMCPCDSGEKVKFCCGRPGK